MANKSWVYTYDTGGNILTKTEYPNATATGEGTTVNYGYMDANWGDLLTSYNGNAITYDGSGNPLSMNGWTFTWQGGRQLKSMTNGATTLNFTYNDSGLRTSKTVGSVTHNYTYQGSTLVADKTAADAMYFHYDQNGSVIGFTYDDGTTTADYYYVKNLQGDILGILDSSGNLIASYSYDAWGNILTATDSTLANRNPLRYRGYYYDTETELYYLQSRYYNSVISRFFNADNYASTGSGIIGYNMFAYCNNSPVNWSDSYGHMPQWIKNAVKWVADNVAMPLVDATQNLLSGINGTYSTGINVSGTPTFWNYNAQIGISCDTDGNVAIQDSIGVGPTTSGSPSGSISGYTSITNAPNIGKLEGMGYQIGGSAIVPVEGVPVALAADLNIIPDSDNATTYYGLTHNIGVGLSASNPEFHIELAYTHTLNGTKFNVFDVARSVYIKIMEW